GNAQQIAGESLKMHIEVLPDARHEAIDGVADFLLAGHGGIIDGTNDKRRTEARRLRSVSWNRLPDAENDLVGELIELLVTETTRSQHRAVERRVEHGVALPRRVLRKRRRSLTGLVRRLDDGLDLGVRVPAPGLLLHDQVSAHAAARELLHTLVVLGAIGVRVEVTRPVVAHVLEELHQEERRLQVGGAEAEIL